MTSRAQSRLRMEAWIEMKWQKKIRKQSRRIRMEAWIEILRQK